MALGAARRQLAPGHLAGRAQAALLAIRALRRQSCKITPHRDSLYAEFEQLPFAFGISANTPNNLAEHRLPCWPIRALPGHHALSMVCRTGEGLQPVSSMQTSQCPAVGALLVAMLRQACHARTTIHYLLPKRGLPCLLWAFPQ